MIGSSMAPATSTTPAVEVWKDIEGFEGFYQVSTKGRVRSLDCTFPTKRADGTIYNHRVKGRMINPTDDTFGYRQVTLRKDHKKSVTFRVHRLVAEAFIPNPDNLPIINHKDESRDNNNVENLEWCDYKYNLNYGTCIERSMTKRSKRVEQLTIDGQHVAFFPSIRAAARAINGNFGDLQKAVHEHHRISYGYHWRLANN